MPMKSRGREKFAGLTACAAFVLAVLAPCAAAAVPVAAAPALPAPAVTGPAVSVTMAPIGLSFEYPVMAAALGTGECPPPALVSELRAFGSPPISLAGDSQDLTAPAGAVQGQQPNWETSVLYSLPASFWSQLHCLLAATGEHLTAGINMRIGQLAWAQQMVAGAESAATGGLDFALGNEPDLYDLPDYAALAQVQSTEDVAAVNLYLQLASELEPALGGAPVIGPELAAPARWRGQLPRVVAQLHEQTVGVHLYPLTGCIFPQAVTVGGLLTPSSAQAPRGLSWVVADAQAAGIPAIISEANSAACGGRVGVSDSPAAGVWALRFVLDALETGFREVRFHFSGGSYDPFVVRGAEVLPRPLTAVLIAINAWLPPGSKVASVSGVKGLVATRLIGSPSAPELILDNETTKPRKLTLSSAAPATVQEMSPLFAGLRSAVLPARRGRVKVVVPAESVIAVMP